MIRMLVLFVWTNSLVYCLDCVSIKFMLLVTGVYTVLKPLSPQADAHQL